MANEVSSDSYSLESGLEESVFGGTFNFGGSALLHQLEAACKRGNGQEAARILQALERGGEDVPSVLNSRRERNVDTFLHLATAKGNVDCVKLLLRQGADCLLKNKEGHTPLDLVETPPCKVSVGSRKGSDIILRVLQSAAIVRAVQINSPELDRFLKTPNSFLEPDCLQRALQEAIIRNDPICAGKLVIKGHLSLDLKEAVCHAERVESHAVHALLLMVKAAFDNDCHLALSLLGQEVPASYQNPVVATCSFRDLQDAVCRNASITATPIEIARRSNSVDVRRELVINTGVNHEKGIVMWHNLRLTELEVIWLKGIQWVQKLVLSNNNLLSIPANAARYLKRATTINLQSNLLKEIPNSLLELPCIQELNLSYNRLQEIPEVREWSSSLALLDLSHNNLQSLPQSCEAPNVRSLDLSYNNFQQVPLCICHFSDLNSLDLSHNPDITKLPAEMGRLQSLFDFKLEGMAGLKYPPKSIYSDAKVCITYLNQKLRSSRGYYRMKLILCGKQARGKTTLVARLRGKDVKESENQSTVGIDVSDWQFSPRMGKQTFTFSVWDFGGQEEYYATHQCFLTQRSVYLLVWNITHGEAGVRELKPWLDNIALRAPNSKVIIVATFYDKVSEEDQEDGGKVDQLLMQVASLASTYQPTLQVKRVTCVGLHGTLHNVDRLKHIIYEEADSYVIAGEKVMGRQIPASYHGLDSHLAQIQKEVHQNKRSPIMHAPEFREMISSLNLTDIRTAEEVKAATLFLHEVGSLLHYDDRKNNLDDLYFVDPRWLCDMMSVMVTVKERNPFIKNGIIEWSCLPLLYRGKQFPTEFLDQYLVLLDRFEIALPLDQVKHRILIPSMLPDVCPDGTDRPNDKVCHGRKISFPVPTPPGFWSRLLARMMHSVQCITHLLRKINSSASLAVCEDNEREVAVALAPPAFVPLVQIGGTVVKYWNSGICFRSPATYLLVEDLVNVSSSNTYGVCVTASSEPVGCRAYGEVVDIIQGLVSEWYPGLLHTAELDQRILCFQCLSAGSSDPYVFSKESLVQYVMACTPHVPCPMGHQEDLVELVPDLVLADIDKSFLLEEEDVVFERDDSQQLGKGGFGSVFRGQCKGQSIAVKVFHSGGNPIDALNELRNEAQIMHRTHHPSLICMVGVLIFPQPSLVMEEAPMGSLEGPLTKRKDPISRIVLFRMAAQIASALKHLHSLSYIYRDLKASNVLLWSLSLDQLVNCKLADFGISTHFAPSGVKGMQGTRGFTAPEVLGYNGTQLVAYDYQADIFSFAMVLFQMITRSFPFNELKTVLVHSEIQEGRRPRLSNFPPAHTSFHFLTGLMKRCWKHSPTDRPTTDETIQHITEPRVQLTMGVHHLDSQYSLRTACVSNDLSVPLCSDLDHNEHTMPLALELWICCDNSEGVELSVFEAHCMQRVQKPHFIADHQVTAAAVCGEYMWMATRVGLESGQLNLFSISTRQHVHDIHMRDTAVSCITCDDAHVYVGTMEGFIYSYGQSLVDVRSTEQPQLCCLMKDCISSMIVASSFLWVSYARQLSFCNTKTLQTKSSATLPDDVPGTVGHLCSGDHSCHASRDAGSLVWSAHLGGHILCAWQTLQQTVKFTIDVEPALLKVEPDTQPNDCIITALCSALDTVWCGMITGHILVFSEEQGFLLHFRPYQHSVRFLTAIPSIGPCGKEECMVLSGGKRYLKNSYLEDVSDDANAPDTPTVAEEVRESNAGTIILWEALRACHMYQVRMLSKGDAWTSHEMINKYQTQWEESRRQACEGTI